MNTSAPEKPLFSMGKVDVTLIDPSVKHMGIIIHVQCFEHELLTEPIQRKAQSLAKGAIYYLITEGFISSDTGWQVGVTILGRPPKE
jgi:hypothetical protein